jgi:sec-independent protein translocase protein TatA
MFGLSTTEIILVVVVILLLFGASRLPAALGGLGKGIKEFKKAVRGEDEVAANAVGNEAIAAELRSGVGKRVVLLEDGTLEIGVPSGATLVEVDTRWAVVRDENTTGKIAIGSVRKVVFRS